MVWFPPIFFVVSLVRPPKTPTDRFMREVIKAGKTASPSFHAAMQSTLSFPNHAEPYRACSCMVHAVMLTLQT